MNRIANVFAIARKEQRSRFIAYLCAGDPNYATSLALCRTLIDGGVDILELGVPFSDPLADGKTNQQATQRALASGISQEQVFHLVREIRLFSGLASFGVNLNPGGQNQIVVGIENNRNLAEQPYLAYQVKHLLL